MEPILRSKNVAKSFGNGNNSRRVLRDINISLHQRETVLITGKSGAGKTVLLWLLSGLDSPDFGKIILGNGSNGNPGHITRGIIFQNYNLIASWTVFENVEFGLRAMQPSRKKRVELTQEMLHSLHLENHATNFPIELSHGQQQRVAIARTLIAPPTIIFADEPTGGVDQESSGELLNLLIACAKKNNSTLVVASHGLLSPGMFDRGFVLNEGMLDQR